MEATLLTGGHTASRFEAILTSPLLLQGAEGPLRCKRQEAASYSPTNFFDFYILLFVCFLFWIPCSLLATPIEARVQALG